MSFQPVRFGSSSCCSRSLAQLAMLPTALFHAWLLIFVTRLALIHAQCYLLGTSSTCTVCWRTSNGVRTDPEECAEGKVITSWLVPLPDEIFEGPSYNVKYSIMVDKSAFGVMSVKSKGFQWDVPHSNIHSCPQTSDCSGACTPFVKNAPGLATHTAAVNGNFTHQDHNIV